MVKKCVRDGLNRECIDTETGKVVKEQDVPVPTGILNAAPKHVKFTTVSKLEKVKDDHPRGFKGVVDEEIGF